MQNVDSLEKFNVSDIPKTPFKVRNSIVEAVVSCFENNYEEVSFEIRGSIGLIHLDIWPRFCINHGILA